jgi:hypothetical protein
VPDVRREIALLVGLVTGALAGAAAVRRRVRGTDAGGADPRAEELRRKLAEAREHVAEEEEFEPGTGIADTAVEERPTRADSPVLPVGEDVDEARRRVHEEGRAAADEMRRDDA